MQLVAPTSQHLREMMGWLSSADELVAWAGPGFRYPFTDESFRADLKLDSLDSFVLEKSDGTIRAFGQCYVRLSRCHLGRLIVAPDFRGQGVAQVLIEHLCKFGEQQFTSNGFSLFVLEHNESAIRAYARMGFEVRNYPEEIPLKNCLYMVKDQADLLTN